MKACVKRDEDGIQWLEQTYEDGWKERQAWGQRGFMWKHRDSKKQTVGVYFFAPSLANKYAPIEGGHPKDCEVLIYIHPSEVPAMAKELGVGYAKTQLRLWANYEAKRRLPNKVKEA